MPHPRKIPDSKKQNKHGDRLFGIVLFFIVIGVAFASVYYAIPPTTNQQTQNMSMTTYGLPPGDPTLTICTSGSNILLTMKIDLKITLLGTTVKIPARIGESEGCIRPIHTTDTSGTIYIESPVTYPFALRDFFAVWNQPFNKNQIFSLPANSGHRINMTVNGVPNNEFENHVFQDGEQINITYT